MSKVDAVLTWINLKGRDEILNIVRTMNENNISQVLIYSKNAISYQVRSSDDQSNVFTREELIEGLKYHRDIILKDDTQFEALLSQFEPILKQTNWFKQYLAREITGPRSVLAFWDGKYEDKNIQGMFELFCILKK